MRVREEGRRLELEAEEYAPIVWVHARDACAAVPAAVTAAPAAVTAAIATARGTSSTPSISVRMYEERSGC